MRASRLLALPLSVLLIGAAPAAVAGADSTVADVTVSGSVSMPATYTATDLAALPQVTLPDGRGPGRHTVTGVDLDALVTAATPTLPADAKNGQLRVLVTVTGSSGSRTLALGEIDPGFGAHPALLALEQDGTPLSDGADLALPGDHGYARSVDQVTQVHVDVVSPAVPAPPASGIVVSTATGDTTLTADQLAALPQQTRTVTFLAGTASQTHTETGPSLIAVLRLAHVRRTATTGIAAVGSDGYVATVTPGEATSGRRPLLISLVEDGVPLAQPRLIAAGDLRGGRDVSGVVGLSITG